MNPKNMINEPITVENCVEVSQSIQSNNEGQARAWAVVYRLCRQKGMDPDYDDDLTGLEKVVSFIIDLHSKSEGKE